MCFYHGDYDWTADVQVKDWGRSCRNNRCDECGEWIVAGTLHRRVWQQERECCDACHGGDDDACTCTLETVARYPDGDPHEFGCGETFAYQCCQACEWFLEAVEEIEAEVDCPPHSRRPMLAGLWEEMGEIDLDEKQKYTERAVANHPELRRHRPVARILEDVREWAAECEEDDDEPEPPLYAPGQKLLPLTAANRE